MPKGANLVVLECRGEGDELQTQRVAAFKHYISDVNSGLFPTEKNLVHAANEVQEFMEKLTGGEDG